MDEDRRIWMKIDIDRLKIGALPSSLAFRFPSLHSLYFCISFIGGLYLFPQQPSTGQHWVNCFMFKDKGYQKKDNAISSVDTNVKGVLYADSRIWDTTEHSFPYPDGNSFFVQTNFIKTENQIQSTCAAYPSAQTICTQHAFCKSGQVDLKSSGIQTGRCIPYNATTKTCQVSAWCPLESKITPNPAIMQSAENFTVLIKNNVFFAAYNYSAKNTVPTYNASCIYNRLSNPLCPIFRLGDIIKEIGENFSQVAVWGAIVGIDIKWDCNLDWSSPCRPEYSFQRLDKRVIDECQTPCFSFRYAKYYKTAGGIEHRTLIKAYGIRFDIQVYGTAAKFNFIKLVLFCGSCFSYFALSFKKGRMEVHGTSDKWKSMKG
ncbi:P2X purinoceptor 7-like [Bombina bombina]|uniref:P2X purinoceptor 7-like n=1 Tax=Bombina bombina TaxID=8345 RepID=UPI00235AE76E|nr:P2X purinoceptor 7-like [Bombina bombina]